MPEDEDGDLSLLRMVLGRSIVILTVLFSAFHSNETLKSVIVISLCYAGFALMDRYGKKIGIPPPQGVYFWFNILVDWFWRGFRSRSG